MRIVLVSVAVPVDLGAQEHVERAGRGERSRAHSPPPCCRSRSWGPAHTRRWPCCKSPLALKVKRVCPGAVLASPSVGQHCLRAAGRVLNADDVAVERAEAAGRIQEAGRVEIQRLVAAGGVGRGPVELACSASPHYRWPYWSCRYVLEKSALAPLTVFLPPVVLERKRFKAGGRVRAARRVVERAPEPPLAVFEAPVVFPKKRHGRQWLCLRACRCVGMECGRSRWPSVVEPSGVGRIERMPSRSPYCLVCPCCCRGVPSRWRCLRVPVVLLAVSA